MKLGGELLKSLIRSSRPKKCVSAPCIFFVRIELPVAHHFLETTGWLLKLLFFFFFFSQKVAEMVNFDASEPVVILGFGQMGQVGNLHMIVLKETEAYSCKVDCAFSVHVRM